ncbi:hypothetical protein SUGI_1047360 [Cryptomeria japonica]|nr:hypothetical protein SUGI_1047360 [Cryptomeria japonica]
MGVPTNNIVEVSALEVGLEWCVKNGAHEIIIEGESQVILYGISNHRFTDWKLDCWIPRIQHLTRLISECTFTHSYREGNSAADCLANMGISNSCSRQLSSTDEILDALLQILIREKSSIPRAVFSLVILSKDQVCFLGGFLHSYFRIMVHHFGLSCTCREESLAK